MNPETWASIAAAIAAIAGGVWTQRAASRANRETAVLTHEPAHRAEDRADFEAIKKELKDQKQELKDQKAELRETVDELQAQIAEERAGRAEDRRALEDLQQAHNVLQQAHEALRRGHDVVARYLRKVLADYRLRRVEPPMPDTPQDEADLAANGFHPRL